MASEEIMKAAAWDVQLMDGILRVSATELGRRLEYNPKHPTEFYAKVVEKHLKSGKLKDIDVVPVRGLREIGIAPREVTEYWLSLRAVHVLALNVDTKAGHKIREWAVDQLMEGAQRPQAAALATVDPQLGEVIKASMAAVLKESLSEIITAAVKGALAAIPKAKATSTTMIDGQGIHWLQHKARRIAKKTGKKSIAPICNKICEEHRWPQTGRLFANVPLHAFEAVGTELDQQYEALPPTAAEPEPQIHTVMDDGAPVVPRTSLPRDYKKYGDLSMSEFLTQYKAQGLCLASTTTANLFEVYARLEKDGLIRPRVEWTARNAKLAPNARPMLWLSPEDAEKIFVLAREDRKKRNGQRAAPEV